MPELAARCCERNRAMSMSEATWLVSQREWGGQGWKPSKRDSRKTGLRKGSKEGQCYLKTVRILASKLFPLLEAVVFMDSSEEGELGRRKSVKKERTC